MQGGDLDSEVRPWGAWEVLALGPGWKVKRLEVTPGRRLSYQTHAHRSEHWTVVAGTATLLLDGRTMVLEAGQSVDVSCGTAHRIANHHDEDLVVIEVQRGHYLGEDDIVRLEDDYGRHEAQ
jgi:mannose-6-phosphate isomerase-like protein (cupin superfamily)